VIFSRDSVEIPSRVDGIAVSLPYWPGDRVEAGTTLAVIDARGTEQELQDAMSAERIATADERRAALDLEQAEAQLRRSSALGNLVSAAELEGTRAQVAGARIHLESANAHTRSAVARLRLSKRALDDANVRAPFDGVVSVRYVEPGAFVHGGSRVLRLVGNDRIWVRFAIPEDRLGEVAVGDRVAGDQPALGASFTAVVTGIAPEIDAATRTVFAEAYLEGRAGSPHLVVGLQAYVRPSATLAARVPR
jgi:RND family efflux transporter MFP subunit